MLAALLLVVTGCFSSAGLSRAACTSNEQCGTGQLCFAEGCGDPGTGIVVEVAGDGLASQFAQDFPIDDGTLGASHDFDLGAPLQIIGEFQRERTGNPDPTNRTFYTDAVRLVATGVSTLVPGIARSFEQRIDAPVRGTYEMAVGAGTFSVVALPVDPSVPPITVSGVAVRAGLETPAVDFVFPSVDGAVTVSGQLLKTIDTSVVPAVQVALQVGNAIDLQAYDPVTRDPLSQRFPVSSGQVGANGNFTITLNPTVRTLNSVLFVAMPRDATSITPTREFVVPTPLPATMTLQLGDFGAPVKVSGQAMSVRNEVIANAQVVLEGAVVGGGTFRSRVVSTDANGVFALDTLEGLDVMTLTIVPPSTSTSAVTTSKVRVPASDGPLDGVLPCDDRVQLTGQLLKPDGTPAAGVAVRAVEQSLSATAVRRPLPLDPVDGVTGDDGSFSLRLDPATWRLDFRPGTLPLASRLVTVDNLIDSTGAKVMAQTLPSPVQLANGRTVSGTVLAQVGGKAGATVPFASVRFFRVKPVFGQASAILLGTTVADERGSYTITLPDATK
jgi:hypothetical protein